MSRHFGEWSGEPELIDEFYENLFWAPEDCQIKQSGKENETQTNAKQITEEAK